MNAEQEDDEDEYEEEEQLVVVHLSGIIDPEYLKKCDSTNCQVLGIETEQPVLQIDKMCFHGSYEDAVGTNVIFEEQSKTVEGKTQTEFKYMCNTVKNLDMVRVFFKREDGNQDVQDQSIQIQDKNTDEGSQGTPLDNTTVDEQRDGISEMAETAQCEAAPIVNLQELVDDIILVPDEREVNENMDASAMDVDTVTDST